MKLVDMTKILRSKNAGPLYITFDLMFDDKKKREKVLKYLSREMIAKAYDTDVDGVSIIDYEIVDSIKITFPRKHISGSLLDDDVYGCQQHMPLANIEIGE